MAKPAKYVSGWRLLDPPIAIFRRSVWSGTRHAMYCGISFLTEVTVINFPLILALVLVATAILWFLAIMFEAKEARPPCFRGTKRPHPSSPISRIGEFAELCTETSTDVAGWRRGRLGL